MGLLWDTYLVPNYQPMPTSVTKLKYYPILGGSDYWIIMDYIDKVTDEEEYKSVHKMVLDGFQITHLKLSKLGQFLILNMTIETHMNVKLLSFHFHHKPFKKIKPLVGKSLSMVN